MAEQTLHRRIVSNQAGLWALPLRAGLRAMEWGYQMVIDARNAQFDRSGPRERLDIPVISVGNLTVGGTGKTPMVIEVLGRLERMGRSPAVVSRGYKSIEGTVNDEELLIRKRIPGAVCVAEAERARGARLARDRFGADTIVLDDGFQHRALARDLDIVLIDSTCPFGFDHLLPRGLLREPVQSLRRADLIVLTKCDQVPAHDLVRLETQLAVVHREAPVIKSRHRVTSISSLDDRLIPESLDGRRAVLFAGIGRPNSFITTARSLGVRVVGKRWFPDHHHYIRRDIDRLLSSGAFPPHDILLTTEKDAVKLRAIDGLQHANVMVVRIDIDFEGDGGRILDDAIRRVLSRRQGDGEEKESMV